MQYKVLHTTGSFGNFIAYLIDSHVGKKLMPSPFVSSGGSHNRTGPTENLHGGEAFYNLEHDIQNKKTNVKHIGCVWSDEYFPYILHASYSRSNNGQYGGCGVEYLEKNFLDFAIKHETNDFFVDIENLKSLFNINVDENNPTVPRHILRQYFWLKLFYQSKHKLIVENNWLKKQANLEKISVEDIMNYNTLVKFFENNFGNVLQFKNVHDEFCDKNTSMKDYEKAKIIIDAVKGKHDIKIDHLSVIGEAFVFFELERYFFDIPFFLNVNFFNSTGDIIDYVKHFPDLMKQPNKLFCKEYKKFPSKDNA